MIQQVSQVLKKELSELITILFDSMNPGDLPAVKKAELDREVTLHRQGYIPDLQLNGEASGLFTFNLDDQLALVDSRLLLRRHLHINPEGLVAQDRAPVAARGLDRKRPRKRNKGIGPIAFAPVFPRGSIHLAEIFQVDLNRRGWKNGFTAAKVGELHCYPADVHTVRSDHQVKGDVFTPDSLDAHPAQAGIPGPRVRELRPAGRLDLLGRTGSPDPDLRIPVSRLALRTVNAPTKCKASQDCKRRHRRFQTRHSCSHFFDP